MTRRSFFPSLIEQPFANGLHFALDFADGATLIAALASVLRGRRHFYDNSRVSDEIGTGLYEVGELAAAEIGAAVVEDS